MKDRHIIRALEETLDARGVNAMIVGHASAGKSVWMYNAASWIESSHVGMDGKVKRPHPAMRDRVALANAVKPRKVEEQQTGTKYAVAYSDVYTDGSGATRITLVDLPGEWFSGDTDRAADRAFARRIASRCHLVILANRLDLYDATRVTSWVIRFLAELCDELGTTTEDFRPLIWLLFTVADRVGGNGEIRIAWPTDRFDILDRLELTSLLERKTISTLTRCFPRNKGDDDAWNRTAPTWSEDSFEASKVYSNLWPFVHHKAMDAGNGAGRLLLARSIVELIANTPEGGNPDLYPEIEQWRHGVGMSLCGKIREVDTVPITYAHEKPLAFAKDRFRNLPDLAEALKARAKSTDRMWNRFVEWLANQIERLLSRR